MKNRRPKQKKPGGFSSTHQALNLDYVGLFYQSHYIQTRNKGQQMEITVDFVLELNARMIGYYGKEINFSNGMMGEDLNLENVKELQNVIKELVNQEDRKQFKYFAKGH